MWPFSHVTNYHLKIQRHQEVIIDYVNAVKDYKYCEAEFSMLFSRSPKPENSQRAVAVMVIAKKA